jgi:hypothetical protein
MENLVQNITLNYIFFLKLLSVSYVSVCVISDVCVLFRIRVCAIISYVHVCVCTSHIKTLFLYFIMLSIHTFR